MKQVQSSDTTFLIVDEVPSSRRLVKVFLKRLGFSDVVEATSGADALEKLKENSVDFIISEHEISDIPGHELCRQVRAEAGYERIPFVLLANSGAHSHEARDAGVSDCLAKPVDITSLQQKLSSVLGSTPRGQPEQPAASV